MQYGYIRVSTKEQQDHRQHMAMAQRGIIPANIYAEKLSDKDANRPKLRALLNKVKKGDTLVVEAISRFARNTKDLLELVERLKHKKVHLSV